MPMTSTLPQFHFQTTTPFDRFYLQMIKGMAKNNWHKFHAKFTSQIYLAQVQSWIFILMHISYHIQSDFVYWCSKSPNHLALIPSDPRLVTKHFKTKVKVNLSEHRAHGGKPELCVKTNFSPKWKKDKTITALIKAPLSHLFDAMLKTNWVEANCRQKHQQHLLYKLHILAFFDLHPFLNKSLSLSLQIIPTPSL